MRHSSNGVGGYRGRRTAHDVLKIIAIVLGILVVLALAALLLGQRYIVYGDDGIRLETPFSQEDDKEKPVDPDDIQVEDASSIPAPDKDKEDKPKPEKKPTKKTMSAVEVPISAVLDGSADQLAKDASANTIVVEMKNREGMLNFVSAQPVAQASGVSSSTANINQTITDWNKGDRYTIARVVCFADNAAPYNQNSVALRASYGNWRDVNKLRWMDPTNNLAQEYMIGLCQELAQMGFDEILLEYAGCPTEGNLEAVQYASNDAAAALSGENGFLSRVKAALAPTQTKLSVETTLEAIQGTVSDGGLTAAGLNQYADHIWLTGDRAAAVQAMTAAGFTEPESKLVVSAGALAKDAEGHQAQLAG